MTEHNVHDYATASVIKGRATPRLVIESLAASDSGAVLAEFVPQIDSWEFVAPQDRTPWSRTVYVGEAR
jgi:hypothetical protein